MSVSATQAGAVTQKPSNYYVGKPQYLGEIPPISIADKVAIDN